jgi:hypothetical protein
LSPPPPPLLLLLLLLLLLCCFYFLFIIIIIIISNILLPPHSLSRALHSIIQREIHPTRHHQCPHKQHQQRNNKIHGAKTRQQRYGQIVASCTYNLPQRRRQT